MSISVKFTAFPAARSEEHMEVVLAVFPALEFIEDPIWEWTEALGTPVNKCKINFTLGEKL